MPRWTTPQENQRSHPSPEGCGLLVRWTCRPKQCSDNQRLSRSNARWKWTTDCNRRSIAETEMYRVKQLFGGSMTLRDHDNQVAEALVMARALKKWRRLVCLKMYLLPEQWSVKGRLASNLLYSIKPASPQILKSRISILSWKVKLNNGIKVTCIKIQ